MELIEMHSSWLVINSIVGCPNGCKYCFLQSEGKSTCLPEFLSSPKEVVKELLNFKYFDKSLPICLFPNTDIFLNERNIDYLLDTLDELEKENINNDLVLITKCLIPDTVLYKLKSIKEQGRNVIVYLSYSGLSKNQEPNINHDYIKQNFKNLYKQGIPIIHYYRPFIPENSSKEKIDSVLSFVHQYTDISAVMGLMYNSSMALEKSSWKELEYYDKEKLKNVTSIWPKEAWDYFYKNYDGEQYFYQTNSCALNATLKKPSQYYGTYECMNYNYCSKEQRKRCKAYAKKRKNKNKILRDLNNLLFNLGIYTKDYCYKYDKDEGIQLYGIVLDVKTLAYLSHMLGIKVSAFKSTEVNDKFNSTLNGSKPYIVGECNE